MAKALAEFTQGPRPNPTTDVMKISQSDSDPKSIYIQLVKKNKLNLSNGSYTSSVRTLGLTWFINEFSASPSGINGNTITELEVENG